MESIINYFSDLHDVRKLVELIALMIYIVCAIGVFYYLFKHRKAVQHLQTSSNEISQLPISVIVYSRNQSEILLENIKIFLEQDYPKFEVIIINDRSFDDTGFILRDFEPQHPNLRVVTINESDFSNFGKKFALTLAIKGATYDHILITELQCKPTSPTWIQEMQNSFSKDTEFVIGLSTYQVRPSFLNLCLRYDSLMFTLNTIGLTIEGLPHASFGTNLALRKQKFIDSKGFASYIHLPDSRDGLLLAKHGSPNNVSICCSSEAIVTDVPDEHINTYLTRKRNEIISEKYYPKAVKNFLKKQDWVSFGFLATSTVLAFHPFFIIPILSFLLIKYIVQVAFYSPMVRKLNYPSMFFIYPFFDLCKPFINFGLRISTLKKER